MNLCIRGLETERANTHRKAMHQVRVRWEQNSFILAFERSDGLSGHYKYWGGQISIFHILERT